MFWWAEAGVLAIALLLPQGPLTPRGRQAVRIGAGLYALAMAGAFVLHTPVGGNAARLGATLAGPLLVGVLWGNHRRILLILAPVLLYWQLETPINDVSSLVGDPSVNASYYAPLRAELHRLDGTATPPTGARSWRCRSRAPTGRPRYLAGHEGIALARGWERQLDTRYGALFYRPGLTAAAYRAWLTENGVALRGAARRAPGRSGRAEGALISHGLPYLREVWRSPHWRLYLSSDARRAR